MTNWQSVALENIANELKNIREILEKQSTTEQSSMVGEWINKQEKYQMAECSNCKKVTMHEMWGDKLVYYDYCPNCGAKMKGADNGTVKSKSE